VLLTYVLEHCLYFLVCVETFLVHKAVQPVLIEQSFCFRKRRLNRVESRRVSYIIDCFHIELIINGLDCLRSMNRQHVHENCQRLIAWPFTKFFEVVYEVVRINSLRVNLSKFIASFLWHGCYHWTITSVDILLINSQIRVLGCPLTRLDWKLREIDLIKVDETSSLFFGLIKLLKNILACLNIILASAEW